MSTTRPVSPGKSRKCPHCRSEILESASICPACRHHLRFGKAAEQAGLRFSALHVEGTLRHPAGDTPWEYSVVITVRNQKGEEVARQVVGIGAMHGADLRTFDLSVDVFAPDLSVPAPVEPPAKTAASTAIKSSTVSPARTVMPPPRQTSTVSASRSISAPRSPASPEKPASDAPTRNPPVVPPKKPPSR